MAIQTPSAVRALRLDADDNVAVALSAIPAGERLDGLAVASAEPIPAGHKIALAEIEKGAAVVKYGRTVGTAARRIAPGEHVHTQNVEADIKTVGERKASRKRAAVESDRHRTFEGIRRDDGRAATRNFLGIVTSVNCSSTVARLIADSMRREVEDTPAVDGIVAITHRHGCGQGSGSEGIAQLARTLTGFCDHPNFAGVLVLGLGCEANQIPRMLDSAGLETSERLRTMTIQEAGGTRKSIETGSGILREMLPAASRVRRESLPVSELSLGLQCGGSDGYSGISANPALGRAADLLVAHGGTVILSETPEIYGAEHLLLDRAANETVADKLRERLEWWKEHVELHGEKLDNNPSPGNIEGGITTIYEKSLGAVAKSGTSPLRDVLRYAERIRTKGFVFMDSPGYDPMSVTGQIASGANLVAFTTGRGSVFGCKPVPSIKIATNSETYRRMPDDMDLNAGLVLDGEASVDDMGQSIFDALIETASGRKTCSEQLGFGDDEFIPWILGAHV